MEFGADQALSDSAMGGQLTGGITAHYGEVRAKVASPYGGGRIDSQGWGVGTNLTWTNADGGYVDAQAQFNWFDSDLSSNLLGRRATGANGDGYALSVEAGKAVAAGSSVRLTPQAQLSYAKVGFDAFTDSFGAQVSDDRSDSLRARLGLALDHAWTTQGGEGGVYGLVNVSHEFLDGTRIDVSGTPIAANARRTWTGLAAGGSYAWGQGRFMVYGEAAADTSLSGFGDSYDISGTAGFRLRF
jgi:fibronectin-binding autotransporter adhesin